MSRMGLRSIAIILIILCLNLSASPQNQVRETFNKYISQAQQAFKEQRYQDYLDYVKQALAVKPQHPTALYYYARAQALTGNKTGAITTLNKLLSTGLILPVAADQSFQSLAARSDFKRLLKKLTENSQPITNGQEALHLAEKDLITEGIAYDSQTETFYISSVHKRKIVSVDKQGVVSDFATVTNDGLWGVFGMQVDVQRRFLWVCSSVVPEMEGFHSYEDGFAGVFQYDLTTKKLLNKYTLSNMPQKHVFGELTLNSEGDVFITDSVAPIIYTISHNTNKLEPFLEYPGFGSLQGLTFSPDQQRLFVSDYANGIFVVDIKSKQVTKLTQPANIYLIGIDGIYFYQNSLVVVQNGINPNRIMRLYLNKQQNGITKQIVLEANSSKMSDPTLGMVRDGNFYFIANGQWDKFNQDGQILPLDKFEEPKVLKIELK